MQPYTDYYIYYNLVNLIYFSENCNVTSMTYYRVSLSHLNPSDQDLEGLGHRVVQGLTQNPAIFSDLPVSVLSLKKTLREFSILDIAAANGKSSSFHEEKRQALVESLDELARYVQVKTHDNLEHMLLSGFQCQQSLPPSCLLGKGEIRRIITAAPTELIVEAKAQPNIKAWEGRYCSVSGEWMPSQISTKSTGIIFTDLTPGAEYQFQMRPISSSEVGDWSDPVSHTIRADTAA